MKKIFFIWLLSLFSWMKANGQNNLPVVYEIKTDALLAQYLDSSYWQVLEDKDGKWTIEQVSRSPLSNKFHKRDVALQGTDTLVNTYWFRYRLKNLMNREAKISLDAHSERDDFYVFDQRGGYTHFRTGRFVPWEEKDGLKISNYIPLMLQPKEELVIYDRASNHSRGIPANFLIDFSNTEKVVERDYVQYVESSTYYFNTWDVQNIFLSGMLFIAIFFNLFFYWITKEREYLYFSLFALFLAMARLLNATSDYVLRQYPDKIDYVGYFNLCFAFIPFFLIQFTRHFFKTYNKYPRWDRLLFIMGILSGVLELIFEFIDPAYLLDDTKHLLWALTSAAMESLIYFFILITFFLYSRKKDKVIKLVIAGGSPLMAFWGVLFLGGTILNLASQKKISNWVISASWLTEIICIAWFVLFFSLILFIRFNQLRKENAQQALDKERLAKEKEIERSQLIEQQKIELEQTVDERTSELKQSLEELKTTQKQLIQSEKMASLGELTAGIAHEIQNPLNFVNNFSEVNNELISEMVDEVDKGNTEEVKAIVYDIKQNLEKINHHGKRADAIVKGMLQHSRVSTGQKEPTDINASADEYLRLSYHGLRAKDKSFHATMKTDYDESIGNINIIPQDIGRVMLNLINNAFYAVTEKKKETGDSYEPTVIVSTKKLNDKVEIRVKDNGNGIPSKVLDKIFQPFFTTKPTGQGTGLGLSLAYDIIKAHGGEIKVNTREGDFTEFVVHLPAY